MKWGFDNSFHYRKRLIPVIGTAGDTFMLPEKLRVSNEMIIGEVVNLNIHGTTDSDGMDPRVVEPIRAEVGELCQEYYKARCIQELRSANLEAS